jgi:MPBQ/MSBQ methyltransferase
MTEHYRRAARLAEILALVEDASPEGLAPLDQFHSGGIAATRELAALAGIGPGQRLLDVGCGVGGPARLLAAECRAEVVGTDLTEDYLKLGRALGERSGARVGFVCADALALPVADAAFDVVWTQHAAMNIADKARLYGELGRVLKPGGRLALHDIFLGPAQGSLALPVPWADAPGESFLLAQPTLRDLLTRLGFRELAWVDRSAATIAFFDRLPPAPRPFGTQLLLGPGFPAMAANLRGNFRDGRIGAAMGVFARRS